MKGGVANIKTLTLRGQFALAENKIPDAIGDFRSVLVDQPNSVNVLKLLASAHLRNNEIELARENMEKVVALAPGDETAQLDLVGLQLKAGNEDQARQQIANLLKADPKSKKGLETLFRLEVAKKDWNKAQDAAKQIQQIKKNRNLWSKCLWLLFLFPFFLEAVSFICRKNIYTPTGTPISI